MKILYESGNYYVTAEIFGTGRLRPKSKGYCVYKNVGTHAKRVATIGLDGKEGLERAINEADRRAGKGG